jgi:predicted alpha-1,2-mannosidase
VPQIRRDSALASTFFVALVVVGSLTRSSVAQAPVDPATLVNPMIGTANSGFTFPGAVVPFGMVTFSPELLATTANERNTPGGYLYTGTTVRGFALTHLSGAGCAGSGDIQFMPLTHGVTSSPALDIRSDAYTSGFSHAKEYAEAGFYRVGLTNGVAVSLTATTRTGAARIIYPKRSDAVLLIRSADNEVGSTDSQVRIDPEHHLVTGSLTSGDFCWSGGPSKNKPYYTVYFAARFDRPFQAYGTWQDAAVRPSTVSAAGGTSMVNIHTSTYSEPGKGSGAYVTFHNTSGVAVGMRVGISFVSVEGAEANLRAENGADGSFDRIRGEAHEAWKRTLSLIAVEGGTRDQQTTFYTALYHSLLQMNVASDIDGRYQGMDQVVHHIRPNQRAQYANFSGWDQYRSQLQLITLLMPEVGSDMAQSLLNQADELGCWSRWTHNTGATGVMNGDPSAPAIADVYAFGGKEFDVKAAYKSLLLAATVPNEQSGCSRQDLQQWESLHYFAPSRGHDNSVADTLEYATADFSISQLAADTGDNTNNKVFLQRAQYWKNLFNAHATSNEGYLQSRNDDGTWRVFDPTSGDGFVEGTGAQYVWMVPFNEAALFNAMGGDRVACSRLNSFFHDADGNWAFNSGKTHPGMDNEPSIETPWLYDYCGEPSRTEQTVAAIRTSLWNTTPSGIPGNDDLGEMSSWYVWSALGMYPEIPGRAELLLASPLFDRAIIHRKEGDIVIHVRRASPSAIYIQSVERNGRPWHDAWLPPSFLDGPQHLSFTLQDKPDGAWGVNGASPPPSFDVESSPN